MKTKKTGKIMLKVAGMHCKSCEMLINDSLSDIDGIIKSDASTSKGAVTVEYDEGKVSLEMIKNAVRKEGYKVL